MEKKVIMAIGGHIGDVELTCGGVLATMALKDYYIVTVALTGGERGNPPHLTVEEYRRQKEKEADTFAKMLNGEAIVFPYTDGELSEGDDVKFALCDLIRKYKPCVLLTHWKKSIHKDHEATYRIVRDAQFYAGLPSIERELPSHYAAGPYMAQNWEDSEDFVPYTYVEVSEEGFELWEKAIETHWFTVNSKSFKYKEYYSHLMACNGCLARTKYAQAFNIEEPHKKVVRTQF